MIAPDSTASEDRPGLWRATQGSQAERLDRAIKAGAIPIEDLPSPPPDAIARAARYFRYYLWLIVGTALLLVVLIIGATIFATVALDRQNEFRRLVNVNACIARYQGQVALDQNKILQVPLGPERTALVERIHANEHAHALRDAEDNC